MNGYRTTRMPVVNSGVLHYFVVILWVEILIKTEDLFSFIVDG